jgi:carbon storage regulator CsrA
MLIIKRPAGKAVRVGGPVEVRVLRVRGNQVSLGFTGPGHVMREELCDGAIEAIEQKEDGDAEHV